MKAQALVQVPVQLGVVAQIRRAFKPSNRLATFVGFCLGGFVPLAVYTVAHYEAGPMALNKSWLFVAGGLAFSALTVFQWGALAFDNRVKAAGFVLLAEGAMVTSNIHWLSLVALAYLILINGIATGCRLSLGTPTVAKAAPRKIVEVVEEPDFISEPIAA